MSVSNESLLKKLAEKARSCGLYYSEAMQVSHQEESNWPDRSKVARLGGLIADQAPASGRPAASHGEGALLGFEAGLQAWRDLRAVTNLDRVVSLSRRLRQERELSFYGNEDLGIPAEELYSRAETCTGRALGR